MVIFLLFKGTKYGNDFWSQNQNAIKLASEKAQDGGYTDIADDISDYLVKAPEASKKPKTTLEKTLETLKQMGFENENLNRQMLAKNNNNLYNTVQDLLK